MGVKYRKTNIAASVHHENASSIYRIGSDAEGPLNKLNTTPKINKTKNICFAFFLKLYKKYKLIK